MKARSVFALVLLSLMASCADTRAPMVRVVVPEDPGSNVEVSMYRIGDTRAARGPRQAASTPSGITSVEHSVIDGMEYRGLRYEDNGKRVQVLAAKVNIPKNAVCVVVETTTPLELQVCFGRTSEREDFNMQRTVLKSLKVGNYKLTITPP